MLGANKRSPKGQVLGGSNKSLPCAIRLLALLPLCTSRQVERVYKLRARHRYFNCRHNAPRCCAESGGAHRRSQEGRGISCCRHGDSFERPSAEGRTCDQSSQPRLRTKKY